MPSKPKNTDLAKAVEWTINLDGQEYALLPSTRALLAFEKGAARTLYSVIEQFKTDGFHLRDLAVAAIALAGAGAPESEMGRFLTMIEGNIIDQPVRRASEMVADIGIPVATPLLLAPLLAALTGKTSAAGVLRDAE